MSYQPCVSGHRWTACLIFALLTTFSLRTYGQQKIELTGYSNIDISTAFGDPADEMQFNMHNLFGGDQEIVEKGTDISFPGMNLFLNSQLSDNLTFQSEIVFKIEDEFYQVELEQLYLKYAFSDKFNLTTGMFITPLGYLARNQRNLEYLNYSYRIRDMINESFGYTPFRTLGFQVNGSFDMSTFALNYWLAYGGARGTTPSSFVLETQLNNDDHSSASFTGNLELFFPLSGGDLNVGFGTTLTPRINSVYIDTNGGEAELGDNPTVEPEDMELSEIIIAPYFRYDASKYQIFVEYHRNTLNDELGNTGTSSYEFNSLTSQIMFKTKIKEKNVFPYLRYDFTKFSNDGSGPYYGLITTDSHSVRRTHAADRAQLMIGSAFDLFSFNRIKVEYTLFLNGPEPQNGISIATAFAF